MKRSYQFLALLLVAGMPSLLGLQSLVSADTEPLPVVRTLSATSVAESSATMRGSIVPGGSTGSGWFEYGTTSALGNTTVSVALGSGAQAIEFSSSLTGLSQLTTYYYRAVGQNSVGKAFGNIMTFTTGAPLPTPLPSEKPKVFSDAPSAITATAVTLKGRVNPMSSETNAWFEYGLSSELGSKVGVQIVPSGTTEVSYTHTIVQLLPSTLYYYRSVAQNKVGVSMGDIISFRTLATNPSPSPTISPTPSPTVTPTPTPTPVRQVLPIILTEVVSGITPTAALIHETVNPNGAAANIWFEYGVTPKLGSTVGFRSLPASFTTTSFEQSVEGLSPNTTYYYRAAAQNIYGDIRGGIFSFITTKAARQIFPTPPVRIPVIGTPKPPKPISPTPSPVVQPAQPINLSPESGTFPADTRSVTLTWGPVAGDVMYAVRVEDKTDPTARDSRDNCPNSPHYICIDDVRATSITVSVAPAHTYNWWVHAVAVKGSAQTRMSKPASGHFLVLQLAPSPIVVGGSETPSPMIEGTPSPSSDLGANLVTPEQSTSRLRLLGFVAVAALGGFALAWLIFGRDRTKENGN